MNAHHAVKTIRTLRLTANLKRQSTTVMPARMSGLKLRDLEFDQPF